MPFAIGLVTLGLLLAISGVKGVSIGDLLAGQGGTSNPAGGSTDAGSSTTDTTSSTVAPGIDPFTALTATTGSGSTVAGTWTAPPGGAHGFKGPNAALLNQLASAAQHTYHLRITATTNGGHVPGSYHYAGRAFDAAGSEQNMHAFSVYVRSIHPQILELIHNPGFGVKNGKIVNGPQVFASVWAGHRDHVHVAA